MRRTPLVSLAAVSALAAGLASLSCGGDGAYSDGGVTNPPPTATLSSLQTSIFTPRCAVSGCHVGAGAPEGMDLSAGLTYGNVVNVASGELPQFLRVEPGDPVNSYLYMKITGDARIFGARMPFGGPYLSPGEIEAVADWILAGAAND